MHEKVEVLKVTKKNGYEIREERVTDSLVSEKPYLRTRAYNIHSSWIGDPKLAKMLVEKKGILPIKRHPTHCICSIGYCEKEHKWYGWSHRVIIGFGIGDRIFEEDFGDDNTLFIRHGRKTIKNMKDARLAAKNFAADVA